MPEIYFTTVVHKVPLAYNNKEKFRFGVGYEEVPIDKIELTMAFFAWYISAYVILGFPETYERHGPIVYAVAILFVVIQWRYFFSLFAYLTIYTYVWPYIGIFYYAIPLFVLPSLANLENYMIKVMKALQSPYDLYPYESLLDEPLSEVTPFIQED